jgi:Putative transposase/Transposase zinc-binding domain
VGAILRRYGATFLRQQPQTPPAVQRVLARLASCRTPALGGHVTRCGQCGEVRYRYHSCGDRHCPACGGSKRAAWLQKRQQELLPVPYFHVVFTLPHQLSALVLGHRRLLYPLLLRTAAQTLLDVAADNKHLGARLGVLAVLHTWGQKLDHHPHVHAVVPGGGLALDGENWRACRPNFLLPVKVLGQVFRGKYLQGLRQAYDTGALHLAGSTLELAEPAAFAAWLDTLYNTPWVVYAKEPLGREPEQVLKYLARYTHRVAFSNSRLVRLVKDEVTFTYKDYADGCRSKDMTLPALEFVRRFALHVVPGRLVRIRQYGLLANRGRGERLTRCRALLSPTSVGQTTASARDVPVSSGQAGPVAPAAGSSLPVLLLVPLLLGAAPAPQPPSSAASRCPTCGGGPLHTLWQALRPASHDLPHLDFWRRKVAQQDSS